MNRRGLFGAFALSPFIAINAIAKERPTGEPEANQVSLILQGNKTKPTSTAKVWAEPKPNSLLVSGNWIETDPNKRVSLSVGEDGNLWLKTAQGQWKRVMTE